jgi:hypothetical protein
MTHVLAGRSHYDRAHPFTTVRGHSTGYHQWFPSRHRGYLNRCRWSSMWPLSSRMGVAGQAPSTFASSSRHHCPHALRSCHSYLHCCTAWCHQATSHRSPPSTSVRRSSPCRAAILEGSHRLVPPHEPPCYQFPPPRVIHHWPPSSVHLWPCHQAHELPLSLLILNDPMFTASDVPSKLSPKNSLRQTSSPSTAMHGDPSSCLPPKLNPQSTGKLMDPTPTDPFCRPVGIGRWATAVPSGQDPLFCGHGPKCQSGSAWAPQWAWLSWIVTFSFFLFKLI